MEGFLPLAPDDLTTPQGVAKLNQMMQLLFDKAAGDGNTVADFKGYASPEGVVVAGIGSTYRRLDGGASTSFYVKESGTAATGWVAK